jgi:hypothetical protein
MFATLAAIVLATVQEEEDNMNIINTTAPISIENLKKYFTDKSILYVIDYDSSALKEQKLLTYLSNLDLPVDVDLDVTKEDHLLLLKSYLETSSLVKVPSLEIAAFDCLMEFKQLSTSTNYSSFIESNRQTISEWATRLDSLTLYNMWCLNDDSIKEWVETFETDESDTTRCVNFVNLLKYENFYSYYQAETPLVLRNYKKLFNDYCFKGKNLFQYWSNENNPMFLLTWGVASGNLNIEEFIAARNSDVNSLDPSINIETGER